MINYDNCFVCNLSAKEVTPLLKVANLGGGRVRWVCEKCGWKAKKQEAAKFLETEETTAIISKISVIK